MISDPWVTYNNINKLSLVYVNSIQLSKRKIQKRQYNTSTLLLQHCKKLKYITYQK